MALHMERSFLLVVMAISVIWNRVSGYMHWGIWIPHCA